MNNTVIKDECKKVVLPNSYVNFNILLCGYLMITQIHFIKIYQGDR